MLGKIISIEGNKVKIELSIDISNKINLLNLHV